MKTKEEIITEILEHNKKIYEETPINERIDFSKTKKNWGQNLFPKKYHIDKNKRYITRNGDLVEITEIKLYNENNKEVTFPVKGVITKKQKDKKNKKIFCTWTIDGRSDITKINSEYDLLEIKNNKSIKNNM